MFEMYFICPTVFFILAIVFPVSINEKIPHGMDVSIGQINAEDIRKMSSEHRNYLQRKVMIHFSLAFIITLVISIMFYIFADANSIMSPIVCNVIGTAIGLSTALLPIIKVANELKKKVNCLENQINK